MTPSSTGTVITGIGDEEGKGSGASVLVGGTSVAGAVLGSACDVHANRLRKRGMSASIFDIFFSIQEGRRKDRHCSRKSHETCHILPDNFYP